MQAFVFFSACLAVVNSQIIYNGLGYNGVGLGYPHHVGGLTYAAAAPLAIAPVATKTQYHAQDELGQASFGHSEPGQAHAAVRDAAGGVRGTFSYISPEGQTLTTHYVADHNGYRVASNALPVAPASFIAGPAPVHDTPEVVAAKAQHFAAVAEAQARSGRKKRGVVVAGAPGFAYSSNVIHPSFVGAPALTYAAAPAVTYAAAPAVTYAAAPAVTYAAAPAVTYAAAPVVHSAVRAATLTKVVNTPGHAVSYRVD